MRRCLIVLLTLSLCLEATPRARAADESADALLERAREARNQGDCSKATALAKRVLRRDKDRGEAYHLMGLCHLDAGDPKAALAHFARAKRHRNGLSPTLLAFDRARALELQGRDTKAERLYLEAARDEGRLGALASVELVLLALRRDDVVAAQDFFEMALLHPESPHLKDELALVGIQLEDAETASKERARQARADRASARASGEERASALTLSPLATEADRSDGEDRWTGSVLLGLGLGFDSNVQYLPRTGDLFGTERQAFGAGGDAYATVVVALGGTFAPTRRYDLALDYAFFQLAYQQPSYDLFAIQEHALSLTQNVHFGRRVTLSLPALVEVSFSGLRETYELFQVTGGLYPELSYRWAGLTRTRVQVGWSRRRVVDEALPFLDGQRQEITLTQSVTWANWLLNLRLRYRRDLLGVRVQPGAFAASDCDACNDVSNITPYSHDGRSVSLLLLSPFGKRVRFSANATYEERPFHLPNRVRGETEQGDRQTLRSWRRFDRRIFLAPTLAVGLWDKLSLVARYTYSQNVSNVDGARTAACEDLEVVCHPLDLQDRNYRKHAASLDLEYSWM